MTPGLIHVVNNCLLFTTEAYSKFCCQYKCAQNCNVAVCFVFQGISSKAMVVLNFNGPLNWRNETNCGKPDTMPGMLTWLLDPVAR